MKSIFLTLLICAQCTTIAQRKIIPTDSFLIHGKIKKEITITWQQLLSFPETIIRDQIIYNHKGEVKDTITGIRGVPLKTLLSDIEFLYEKPKDLNEFYFVFVASDGYKVVFSWNEIYNTKAGDEFYFITAFNGKKSQEPEQRILFLSTADLKSGRRYIKGLQRIDVKRTE